MIWVISSGEFSSKTIIAVIQGDDPRPLHELLKEFGQLTDRPPTPKNRWKTREEVQAFESWVGMLSLMYLGKPYEPYDGDGYAVTRSFVAWLVQARGFKELEYGVQDVEEL